MALQDPYAADLCRLESIGRLRALRPRAGLDFSSNDYLALAGHPALAAAALAAIEAGVPVGSGGSRLLRGNHPEHEALEREAAALFGSEAALFFSSGYAANVAILSTLPQTADAIFHDTLVHASSHEGIRLARCPAIAVPHNDAQAFANAIVAWRQRGGQGRPWIAVESLYSMDGDIAPLAELADIAAQHDAYLIIDEAHATGVSGTRGTGLAERLEGRANVVTLHTLGKALGCEGALICLPAVMRDFMVNRSRGFIFSTAPSPLIAAVARAALRLGCGEPVLARRLADLSRYAARRLARHGVVDTGTQIMPLLIGEDDRTMAIAARLADRGCDVRGIRPPTVPVGTARLRISITLNIDETAIDRLDRALAEVLA
jgi:8-amino-7-oxononanoate synthase